MSVRSKPRWLVRDSSGDLFFVAADNLEEVYRTFAREQLKMDVGDDFDSGDVDVDVAMVPRELRGCAPADFVGDRGVT